jgi:hypothetical protein
MKQRTCELEFAGEADVQLLLVRYVDPALPQALVTVRGKTSGAFGDAGTFQWTSAVRGLCVLFIKAKLAQLSQPEGGIGFIFGDKRSLAASLDYAITKQPYWIRDLFGTDASGNSMAKRLISRTNSHRKRPGPVVLSVNARALPASNIHIIWKRQRIECVELLRDLLIRLNATYGDNDASHPNPTLVEQIAA